MCFDLKFFLKKIFVSHFWDMKIQQWISIALSHSFVSSSSPLTGNVISRCSQCFFWNLKANRWGQQGYLCLTVLFLLVRKQIFLSTSVFFLNCSTIYMFSLGRLCLKVFFSCSVVINTYVVILLSWFLFFVFLISMSSHCIEYNLE